MTDTVKINLAPDMLTWINDMPCLALTRDEATAILGISERLREANLLLGEAVLRAEAQRSFRRRVIEISDLSTIDEIIVRRRCP